MNKTIREFMPRLNVFGNINTLNTNNQFAQGESKYKSIFSPYINEQVFGTNEERTTETKILFRHLIGETKRLHNKNQKQQGFLIRDLNPAFTSTRGAF